MPEPEEIDSENLDEKIEEERAYNELATLLRMTNEGYDRYAEDCYNKAVEMMKQTPSSVDAESHYDVAIGLFKEAAATIRHSEKAPAMKEKCEAYERDALYCKARALFKNTRNAEAKAIAEALEKQGYKKATGLIEAINEEVQKPKELVPETILPEFAKDEHKLERMAVAERLKRATIYYQLSKYAEANNQIELVLRDDPNNLEAITLRKRLNLRHADRNRALKMSTRAKMISDVEANWTATNALGVESEEFIVPEATTTAKTPVDEKGERDAEIIRNKLETIRLPEFSIAPPSTIADAVPLFAELAKLYDKPDLPPEERGISFVLNATSKKKAAPVEEEEDAWASSDDSGSEGDLKTLPPINLTYVTLKDALDMVCEVSGFKYTIRGRTILLVPPGTVSKDEFQTRKYNVMPDAIQKLVQASNEMAEGTGGGGGNDDGWGSGMDASSDFGDSFGGGASPDVLRQTFQNLGVPFADDAKVFYLSTVGKLHVTNTPENLALVENILEEYNVTPFQIEVEARFVEVSQSDLNSLGFEWRLNGDILGTVGDGIDWASSAFGGAGKTTAGGKNGQGAKVFRGFGPDGTGANNIAVHGGANAFNQGTRFLGDSGLYANRVNLTGGTLPVDDTFLTFSAVFGELDMTMILHMLAQRSDTDMLSSPKVLAKNEEDALIRVVTEWIYPTEFEIQELDNDNNNNWNNNDNNGGGGQIANQPPPVKFAVEPSSFEKQEVGVKLQVMPRVLPEGQMIELVVQPSVVEYLGDFEYGMQIPYVKGVTESLLSGTTENEIGYYQVSMPQPKFHFREIQTKLSIYNGATVVLGGLITETRKSFEDKVPFFGDLPFIGFLFRSSGEYSEKRNLLIFISARLVDPAGRPIKMATDGRLGAHNATPAATTMGAIEE
ncbi:MAG: hypothetical protein Q4F99_06750 [bacterium]|nr:hypothetical protein [bacterium]